MRQFFVSIVVFLVGVGTAFADSTYLDFVDEADKACADGDWGKALDALNAAMLMEPDNPGNILLLNNVGMIQHNLGMDTTAVATLSEAHRRAPASVTILMNRAKVLTSMGKFDGALEDYALVMELDPTEVLARFNHGMLSMSTRRFYDAKADFDYLESSYPDTPEAMTGAATMHRTMGDYDKAIPYYTQLIDLSPDADYYGARAYCRLMTGDLQEASDDIARALELAPSDGELYLYRAALNKMRYRPDDARVDARRAVELGVSAERAEQYLK